MALHKDDPTVVGNYRLESRLGSGGMGVVYLARSASGRAVALKVVRRQWAEDVEFRKRFELEVAASRMVHSMFTVPVVDADPYAEAPWMAAMFVPGEPLSERVDRDGPLGPWELRALGVALATALRDVHRTGVVHRDLKPGNVLLTVDGPRVIDFGISRAMDGDGAVTRTGQVVGTPAYMAPEQFTDPRGAGPAGDIFSLGCVLAFAATGRSPFHAESSFIAAYKSLHEEPDLTAVPGFLRPVIARCLAKDPAVRPAPGEVMRDIALAVPEPEGPAPRAVKADRTRAAAVRGFSRPLPAWVAVAAVLATAIGAFSIRPSAEPVTGSIVIEHALPPAAQRVPSRLQTWERRLGETRGSRATCRHWGGSIYCASTGGTDTLLRIDPADGGIMWRRELRGARGVTLLGISAGRLFYLKPVSRRKDHKRVHAVDTDTGEALGSWRGTSGSKVSGGVLYLREPYGGFEAVGLVEDSVRWRLDGLAGLITTSEGLFGRGFEEGDGRTEISAIDPGTGGIRWKVAFGAEPTYCGSEPGALYFTERASGPGTDGHRVGSVVRLDVRTREVLRTPVELEKGVCTVQEGIVYHLGRGGDLVAAVDAGRGGVRWVARTENGHGARPTVVGDRVYLHGSRGNVTALDARTGERLWGTHPQWTPRDGGGHVSPVMADEEGLYVLFAGQVLYSLDVFPGRD